MGETLNKQGRYLLLPALHKWTQASNSFVHVSSVTVFFFLRENVVMKKIHKHAQRTSTTTTHE